MFSTPHRSAAPRPFLAVSLPFLFPFASATRASVAGSASSSSTRTNRAPAPPFAWRFRCSCRARARLCARLLLAVVVGILPVRGPAGDPDRYLWGNRSRSRERMRWGAAEISMGEHVGGAAPSPNRGWRREGIHVEKRCGGEVERETAAVHGSTVHVGAGRMHAKEARTGRTRRLARRFADVSSQRHRTKDRGGPRPRRSALAAPFCLGGRRTVLVDGPECVSPPR